MTRTATLETSAQVLAFVREQQRLAESAQGEMLRGAAEFAAFHSPESLDPARSGGACVFGERAVDLAGAGAPGIAEFAVVEFAANLGWSTEAGRAYLAEAMELRYRLGRTYALMSAGTIAPSRARRVASHTIGLSPAAAAHVDAQVAAVAGRIGPSQLDRLCDEARARFDPDAAEQLRAERAEQRQVRIRYGEHGLDEGIEGLGFIEATLDAADAKDFEHAVAQVATTLLDLGSTEPLDVRRARAVGEIARGQLCLDLARAGQPSTPKARRTVLTLHLSDLSLASGIVTCDELRTHLSVEQVLGWMREVDQEVIIQPVIDLRDHRESGGYQPSERVRRHVLAGEENCAFPYCARQATRCDGDHVVAHAEGGPTCSCNLAPLCRLHHRAKTHGRWSYDKLAPGTYLWRSATGLLYERTPDGTTRLPGLDPPPQCLPTSDRRPPPALPVPSDPPASARGVADHPAQPPPF